MLLAKVNLDGDTPKNGGDTPCKSRGNPEEESA